MIYSGLCSITFRKLEPARIVELATQAGIEAIEWGGDIHVPHGDLERAREVRNRMGEMGLRIPSYGSYYRVVQSEHDRLKFATVLETAQALGAPVIRVWAGAHGSGDATDEYRCEVVKESQRIADMAANEGVRVSYEWHGGTLTDTNESALELLRAVDRPNVGAYWQPAINRPMDYRLAGLNDALPWLDHLHVFQWKYVDEGDRRRPLAEGAVDWRLYFEKALSTGRDHCAVLEFVRGDDPDAFLEDARTLKDWLACLDAGQ